MKKYQAHIDLDGKEDIKDLLKSIQMRRQIKKITRMMRVKRSQNSEL